MTRRILRLPDDAPFYRLVGVGGVGTGIFLALEGDRTLGRSESRAARLLDARDYCKLHIVEHYVATLLGAERFGVVALGAVGDDEHGRRLVGEMREAGIDVTHVATRPRPTLFSVCFLYPNGEGGNITTSDSAAAALAPDDVEAVRPLLGERTIALAAPEVPLEARGHLLELATGAGAFRVASFTSYEVAEARAGGLFERIDLLFLNHDEASVLADRAFDAADPGPFLERSAAALTGVAPRGRVVLSAGADGAFAFADGRWRRRAALPVAVSSTAGAGDALLAGVIAGIVAGVPLLVEPEVPGVLASALDLGVLLASLSVTSPHTIHPDADVSTLLELAQRLDLAVGGPLAEVL